MFRRSVRLAIMVLAAVLVAALSAVVAPATAPIAGAYTSCTGTFPYNAWHNSGTQYAHEYGWYWGTTNPRAVCVGQADLKENFTNATGLNERVRVRNGPSNGPLLYQHESGGTISGDAIIFITHVSRVFDADVTVCGAVVHQSDQSVVPNTTVCKSLYAPTSNLQPVGDPLGRTWTPVLDDEFNGTSIDTSKWVALNGWGNNNVTSKPKNCTESGGNLVLSLPGDGTGCDLYSGKSYGAGANAHDLLVGDYLEARIWFPGPGTAPTSTLYNWPAFWAYDGSGNWKAGENDIAEALNHLEYNYSANYNGVETDAPNVTPSGNWGNSWHVYGIYRSATQTRVFYDGTSVFTFNTGDDGGPESIMFTSGKTDSCCGAPTAYGAAGNVLVDWVRDWH